MRAAAILAVIWLAAWIVIDHWQSQPDPVFYPGGVPLLAWYALALLALAAVLWRLSRPAAPFGSVLVVALGAVPAPLLLTGVAAEFLDDRWFLYACIAAGVYTLVYLARALHAVTGETQRAAACAGLVLIAGFGWLTDSLDAIPDVWTPTESTAARPGDARADAESLLFSQADVIDDALEGVAAGASSAPGASSGPKGYFVGFAGVGDEKVFAQEIGLASRVLGERYGMESRSISLINDERDLERAPLATVSGLRYALRGLAERMNPDEDVLFLSISSHGAQNPAIVVANSQLPLRDMSDEDLADALRESGIKWRVIIISACYAGGFIDSLRNAQTIVITASAADRTSFGCSNDRDLTYFGEAFYRDALPGARSLRDAFDAAKAAIAARESREHVTPSEPQAYFGAKMEAKLAAMGH